MESSTTQQVHLAIDGMSCGHCVAAVSRALRELPGVAVEQVGIGVASVAVDPRAVSTGTLVAAVEDAGYGARVVDRPPPPPIDATLVARPRG